MNISIIGCGLIGCERIKAVKYISNLVGNVNISNLYDIDKNLLLEVGKKYNLNISDNINNMFDSDWIFIATPNNEVINIIRKIYNNINILVEKPLGCSLSECEEIINLKPKNSKLYVGFNYRFFRGVELLLNDIRNNRFGKLISVNLTLVHGNKPGSEKSWRFDPIKCSGCMEDLSVHLFDLILQISSDEVKIDYIKNWSGFWNTGIDEESHVLLSNKSNTIFSMQVSFNRWKNVFKLEVNGTEGYGIVEGKGGNYGPQSYRVGKRWGWLSGKNQVDTEEVIINSDDCKDSFIRETIEVLGLSEKLKIDNISKPCDYNDAKKVMKLLSESKNI